MSQQPLTDAQLDAAWRELARRGFASCRRATLADALAGAVSGALVRLHARLLSEGVHPFAVVAVQHRQAVQAPEPPPIVDAPTTTRRRRARRPIYPTPAQQQQPGLFVDRKRAAAGDRDDD
jgi:hypothetical protein